MRQGKGVGGEDEREEADEGYKYSRRSQVRGRKSQVKCRKSQCRGKKIHVCTYNYERRNAANITVGKQLILSTIAWVVYSHPLHSFQLPILPIRHHSYY